MVDAQDLDLDVASQAIAAGHLVVARNLEVLADWAQRPPQGRSRRLHLHFWLRPVRVLDKAQVSGVASERMPPDHMANAQPTGHLSRLDGGMLVRAVGYRRTALPGLPFDGTTGTIPNASGRVLRDGITALGEYVASRTGHKTAIVFACADQCRAATTTDRYEGAYPRPVYVDRV
ncbi:MAG: hypothetical protein M3171_04005 [Actinomycetota bacterium]|nr:hypothetical protein [Actinomycetota bacterium]